MHENISNVVSELTGGICINIFILGKVLVCKFLFIDALKKRVKNQGLL